MPEIKHDFTAGKMNKDLDERLVPNGEYRDAVNIQVRTTDGGGDGVGNSGTAQNLQGNVSVGYATGNELISPFTDTNFKCVGAIAHEKTDKAYFLFTSGGLTESDITDILEEKYRFDTIIEQDLSTGQTVPVVVDKWAYQTPITISGTEMVWSSMPTGIFTQFTAVPTLSSKIRENMTVTFYLADNTILYRAKIKEITADNVVKLYDQVTNAVGGALDFTSAATAVFKHERMLNFDPDINITGLNIIDDLLFFTDNVNEPKKINITRCKDGTDLLGDQHTQLRITDENGDLQDGGDLEFSGLNSDLLEEHITVIRPAPKTPPTLDFTVRNINEMKFSVESYWLDGTDYVSLFTEAFSTFESGNTAYIYIGSYDTFVGDDSVSGDTINYGIPSPSLDETSFQPGDIITVKSIDSPEGYDELAFKIEFVGYLNPESPNNNFPQDVISSVPTTLAKFRIVSLPEGELTNSYEDWEFEPFNLKKPRFELKFARFGYRYKYEDGEYSPFSPWSELAFDPGVFDYDPKKGYNLGMVNTIQELTIKDFIPYYTDRALDIVEVDILYKSTDSPNVYTVKTIKKEKNPEWELFSPNNLNPDSIETGKLKIKTENIHRVIPSNQTLRAYDNVPRTALAQEITGSRILYGNFTQGFDITFPVGLTQDVDWSTVDVQPKKSIKTIRDYTLGMVLGDKYGRETPVITSNKLTEVTTDGEYDITSNDINVIKWLCDKANKFVVKQEWENPLSSSTPDSMEWLDYVKYYVKETSNEYYNLVLDRWYYARDKANIWLSFPSADRNKVDIETYLILKKEHGGVGPVLDKARYKIIAIENEAPDFIKTDHRNMGMLEINPSNVTLDGDDLNTAEPVLLTNPDKKEILIDGDSWYGFLDRYGEVMRGDLYARVVGRTVNENSDAIVNEIVSGDFKKVTHHYNYSSDETEELGAKIIFSESFGQSANMVDRFNDAGFLLNESESDLSANDLKYYLEFKEQVVENKPEFDGRFFVLIEKDFSIEEKVEKLTISSAGFLEIDQITISYVDTQKKNPALNGPFSSGGTGAGDIWGGIDTDTNYGLYNNTQFGSLTLTDPGAVDEWWGFGNFYYSAQSGIIAAGNDTIDFFALGCNHLHFYNIAGIDEATNEDILQAIQPIDVFSGSNNVMQPKTLNFGGVTKAFWGYFKDFHASVNAFDGENRPRDRGSSRSHLIFLDGARANQLRFNEPSTDISSTDNVGVYADCSTCGDWESDIGGIVTNDIDIYQNPTPVIYNYKPTALDEGRAGINSDGNQTYGRMVISQLSKNNGEFQPRDGHNDVGDALDIYSYFSTVGTYFEFAQDDSNDGKPHVYQVIGKDIDNPEISIPPQHTDRGHNYGEIGSNTNLNNSTQDGFKSMEFGWTSGFGGSNNVTLTGGSVNYGGENADIWTNANLNSDYINNVDAFIDADAGTDDPVLRVGVKVNQENNDGQNTGGFDKQWKWKKQCGRCDSDAEINREGELCNRTSIRFEFRKVDLTTGLPINEGIDITQFDPRGYAKHDGTAGGIQINILQNTNIIGGDPVEVETDKSVWETEPKEGTELDIYHEASHAIPLSLKKGNTFAFAPLKSKVYIKNSTEEGFNYLTSDFDGNSYSNIMVGGAEYAGNSTTSPEEAILIKVISDTEDTTGAVHIKSMSIGDEIFFEHSSGLITKSKIEDYYVLDTNNVTYKPQTEYTVDIEFPINSVNLDSDSDSYLPYGYINVYDPGTTDAFSNLSHGMNLVHDSIPNGVFLKYFTGVDPIDGGIQFSTINFVQDDFINIYDPDGTGTLTIPNVKLKLPTGYYKINKDVYKYEVKLGWHNCWSFGNGVESDRIRDDFNAPQLDNGVKVSTTISDYGQEDRTSSLIFSGLYNTTSGVNDLNEFNMGENIIKDVNPAHGSIQALKTRDTDVVTFCEDKVLKIVANKEAVYKADGNPDLVATNRVLGQTTAYVGDYGISKNPESLATDQYRMYFTDSQRGAVLRLSRDGLTPISNVGMKTWFRENLKNPLELLGTFDIVNGEYNLTINNVQTVSFNEAGKGWVSFKTFIPDQGVSVSGSYLTVKNSGIFKHYVDTIDTNGVINNRNAFYGADSANSSITLLFNDMSGSVKSYKTVNYEGSQARIDRKVDDNGNVIQDGEYYNIYPDKKGWWVTDLHTDLQHGQVKYFMDKENKWFNRITGSSTNMGNLDSSEFTVQGIGLLGSHSVFDDAAPQQFTLTIKNDPDQ